MLSSSNRFVSGLASGEPAWVLLNFIWFGLDRLPFHRNLFGSCSMLFELVRFLISTCLSRFVSVSMLLGPVQRLAPNVLELVGFRLSVTGSGMVFARCKSSRLGFGLIWFHSVWFLGPIHRNWLASRLISLALSSVSLRRHQNQWGIWF